jgi:hypothetical protein
MQLIIQPHNFSIVVMLQIGKTEMIAQMLNHYAQVLDLFFTLKKINQFKWHGFTT